jgi:beta-lactamase regulating signal transducer with metallopeptidase domain
MSPLSSTLLWCALQTTLLALLTLMLGSRPWRFGGATAPLLGLIGVSLITLFAFLPIPWSWTTGLFDRQRAKSLAASTDIERKIVEPYMASSSVDQGQLPLNAEAMDTGFTYVTAFMDGLIASTETTQTGWSLSPVSTIVLGLFGTGIIIGTLRLIVGLAATRRLIRTCILVHDQQLSEAMAVLQAKLGMKTLVVLYETDKLSTAATLGMLRPRILLPMHWREWTDEELSAVLAHELAHIAHGDFAAVMATQLSLVVHFYHPLVHWLAGRLRLEQELAADSVAAQIAGGQVRYVRVLAKLALEHQDRFVGWPARAFLPTRQTFLRRLEMLRDVKLTPPGRTPVGKWAAMAAIMVASVALVGLKPPPNRAMAQDTAAKPSAQSRTSRVEYDLRYFSDAGGMLIAARPAELLASNSMSEIAKMIQELPMVSKVTESLGIKLQDVEQVLVAFESLERMPPMPTSFCVRTLKPIGKLSDIVPGGRSFTLAGAETLEVPPQGGTCLWKPDDRTLVFGSKSNVERWIQGRQVDRKLTESELWNRLKDRPLLVMSEGKVLRNIGLPILRPNGPAPMLISSILSPILDEAEALGLAASMDKEWSFVAMAKSKDAKGASIIQETSQASLVLMKTGLRELKWTLKSQPQTPSAPSDSKNAMEVLLSAGTKLAEAAKVQTDGGTVSVTTSIPLTEVPISSIVSALIATRKAADRSQSANNLKQIALAFHMFESANRKFPHSTKSPDPSHKHPVSWRVMILPFMEQKALYNLYRFDEPWDGPNNSKLLSMVPIQYRHPEAPAGSTNTPYLAITGEEAMFQPSKETLPSDVRDGLANTIMVVESKSTIPWTKPDDLAYASDKPLPFVGGFFDEGFHAAFGDGSVRFISKTIAESVLRALMTARGGETDINQ